MQRRQSCTQQNQARLHLICISSAYDFWILDRLFCILCFKKKKTNNNERELCAFSDSWAQAACFWATWETCSTRHRRTPAQLDDARCQTGVSRRGTPASLQHPTICLKPRWRSLSAEGEKPAWHRAASQPQIPSDLAEHDNPTNKLSLGWSVNGLESRH